MPNRPVKLVLAMLLFSCVFPACSPDGDEYHGDLNVVLPYLAKERQEGDLFVVHVGPYEGGTAVLSKGGMAFWVWDGVGYVVNEKAVEAAPKLGRAPEHILLDDAFQAAARTGE